MTDLNTIQKDTIVLDLINLLKQRSRPSQQTNPPTAAPQAKSTYQKFVESGLIGCVEIEEDLSTTYKQVLAQELAKKYDHR
ncbi:MAG: DUF2281 domain-containing protein [Pseudanabaena sp.]|jgi:hypothetical protein|nr:hypothetical protein [Pseudanabaena sp. 42896M_M3]